MIDWKTLQNVNRNNLYKVIQMPEKSDKVANKSNKAVNSAKRCACGFESTEFAFGLASIGNKIGELRVYESKLSPDLIRLHQQVAGHALEHLHKIREFCNIDTTEEEKRLIKLQTNLQYINIPEKRNELSDDTTFITDGVRRKLYGCAREK